MQRPSRGSHRTIPGVIALGIGVLAGCELFTEVRTRHLQVCEPNTIRCGPVNRQVCDDQGTEWIDAACMGTRFLCTGDGDCVQCLEPSGTLRPDFLVGDCQANLCVDGTIVFIPDDDDLYDPVGDCRHVECHDGRMEVVNDDTDVYDDGDVCTRERCDQGFLTIEPTTSWGLPCLLARGDSTGYACARTPSGTVYCWGRNDRGQLGLGFTGEFTYTPSLLNVYYVRGVTMGHAHACAWDGQGTLWCWGANDFGQARGFAGVDSAYPLGIITPNLVVWASAGREHSCAVLVDGTAVCWGRNDNGQLGDGTTDNHYEPTLVLDASGNPLGGLVQIEAGGSHTCARDDENVLYCWGAADEVGAGGPPDGPPVAPTPVLTGVELVSTGSAHTCAITTGGKVSCWGNNEYGQCGDPPTEGMFTPIPTEIADLTDVTTLSAGARHTCAASPNAQCWGTNFHGELGQNDGCESECPGAHSVTPSAVVTSDVYTQIEAYNGFGCALTEAGQIACWGRGETGQLGNQSTESSSSPVYVAWPVTE